MLREMSKILKTINSSWRFVFLILLRSPVNIAMTFVNAFFLQQAFNSIMQNNSRQLINTCVIFGIASLCIFLYNGSVWSVYAAPLVTKMEGTLRIKLFRKISSLSYEKIEALPQGEWLTRLNTDVQMPFSESWPHTAVAVVNICVSSYLLWRLDTAVFGWILLFVIPHIAFSQLLIARAMPGFNKKSLAAMAQNTDELTTLVTCADIAALYDGQEYFMKRFEKSSRDLLQANMKMHARNALGAGVLPLFGLGGYLTLLIVSSRWIAEGRLTFGDLTAAFSYRGGVLLGALMLINSLISIQAGMAGIRRLNVTLAEETEESIYG